MASYPPLSDEQAAKFDAFCDRIEHGDNLKEALKAAKLAWGQVCRYVDKSPEAEARYARARSASADWWAARATEAAEAARDKDDTPAQKLKFDARRWRAAMANPKRYGDKMDHTTDGKPIPAAQVWVIGGQTVTF